MAEDLDLYVQTVPFNPIADKEADTVYGLQLRDASQEALDLTGYTAKLTIYPYQRATKVYDTLSTEADVDEARRIKMLDDTGVVWITFPAEKTAEYKWTNGWYKLEITSAGGKVYRIADGSITMRD